jgi:rubredoxin
MKHVFTATTMSADQEIVKGLFDEANIPCMIRNDQLAMGPGELAPSDCAPEVWILNDEDYPRAKEIVEAVRNAKVEIPDAWTCPSCGEAIEGQFTSCWNCGRERKTA